MKPVTVDTLLQTKINQEKFSCIAAYDAIFARVLNQADIDVILVGDSLGMVLQGHPSTVPVTLEQMVYHTQCVTRGNQKALIMADMPFMTFSNTQDCVKAATALMQAGAHMVKIEGGQWLCDSISTLVAGGIPVCAHIGLTPQSVNTLGGYKVQGRSETAAEQMISDAKALEKAGAQIILMECVPTELAKSIDAAVSIPTIGIGAGPNTTGQVLVLHDLLGLNPEPAKFVKNFMQGSNSIQQAVEHYNQAVKDGSFPSAEHSFK
jgi:3-methyl-2-oxobutanoate hydroxymethyltransferase